MTRDPWHRVAFGALADASDKPGLATVKQELHDELIAWAEREGFTRAGPVTWRWWPSPKAPGILHDLELSVDKHRQLLSFCRRHPAGLLVCASVELAASEDERVDAEVQEHGR